MAENKKDKGALLLKLLREKREYEDRKYEFPDLNNKYIKLLYESKFIPFETINTSTLNDRNIQLKRKNPKRISNQLKHKIGYLCQIGNDVKIGCSQIDNNVCINDGCYLGDNIHICENSIIGYRTYVSGHDISEFEIKIIGRNVIIGNDCELDVSIGENSFVGDNSTIRDKSIIGNNIRIGTNAFILKSYIGFNSGNEFIGNNFNANNITTSGNNRIGNNVSIDEKSKIGEYNIIGKDVSIGKSVFIGEKNIIERNVIIGNFTNIGEESYIYPLPTNRVFIGENSKVGHNVSIGNNVYISSNVNIGNNVSIGEFSIIESGSEILDNVVIGNNVLVRTDSIIKDGSEINRL